MTQNESYSIMTLAVFAVLFLAQVSEPSVTPAIPPPVVVPSVPRIEAHAKQQLPDNITTDHKGGSSASNSTKEGWFDKVWAFMGGLIIGWIGSLISQWVERRGDGKRLKSICFLRIREAKRRISAFTHASQFTGIHCKVTKQLQIAVSDRLEWMRGKQQCKAADAWDAFRDFTGEGCSDANAESCLLDDFQARYNNYGAETVKGRFVRLLDALESALQ